MPTSRTTFALSSPKDRDPIPAGVLEYMQTRNRLHVFTLVQKEFERSGITQAELADRLGKGADRVCKLFSAPGNWTLDTVSDFLWAISGGEIEYRVSYPLDRPSRNLTEPDWLLRLKESLRTEPGSGASDLTVEPSNDRVPQNTQIRIQATVS